MTKMDIFLRVCNEKITSDKLVITETSEQKMMQKNKKYAFQ